MTVSWVKLFFCSSVKLIESNHVLPPAGDDDVIRSSANNCESSTLSLGDSRRNSFFLSGSEFGGTYLESLVLQVVFADVVTSFFHTISGICA